MPCAHGTAELPSCIWEGSGLPDVALGCLAIFDQKTCQTGQVAMSQGCGQPLRWLHVDRGRAGQVFLHGSHPTLRLTSPNRMPEVTSKKKTQEV